MGDFFSDPKETKANKPHECIACYGKIDKGERYIFQSGHFNDEMFNSRYHKECFEELNKDGDFEFIPGEMQYPERNPPVIAYQTRTRTNK